MIAGLTKVATIGFELRGWDKYNFQPLGCQKAWGYYVEYLLVFHKIGPRLDWSVRIPEGGSFDEPDHERWANTKKKIVVERYATVKWKDAYPLDASFAVANPAHRVVRSAHGGAEF